MIRLVGGKLQALASCDEWQPRSDGWHCEGDKISRFIELHDPRAKLAEGVASKSPFVLNPGASVEANPFRFLADGTPVKIGLVSILMDWWKKDDGPAVSTCNAAMTLCERKELLNAALWAKPVDKRLIRTTIRWNDGKWISLRGSTADADWNGNVTRVDSRCSQFSPGLEGLSSDCLSGEVVLDDGVKWRGGYTLSTMGRHPVVSGFGRLTFKDGRWVEGITKSEGEWISLSRCGYEVLDDSVDPGVACCRLRGQTVVFDR
jgi:hypothetical protein